MHALWVRAGRPGEALEELVDLAGARGVPVRAVDGEALAACAEGEGNPQGVALSVGPLPELSLEGLLEGTADRVGGRRIVALDGVEDPRNVGAIARVAEAAGASGLLLTQRRSAPLSPTAARASAGAIEWLPVARVPNLVRALGGLQAAGFWVLASAVEAATDLYEMEDRLLTGDLVVVLGAEGKGVRPSTLDVADHRVALPMEGRVESLNVSTAGAVVLYELLRRARGSQPVSR